MVATSGGRVVTMHGDAKGEVNRGINCVKGYFLSTITHQLICMHCIDQLAGRVTSSTTAAIRSQWV